MLTLDEALEAHWREFGRYLKRLIQDAELEISEFAKQSEMTPTQASRILNGKSGTRRATIPRIVAALRLRNYGQIEALYKKAGFTPPPPAYFATVTASHSKNAAAAGSILLLPPRNEEIEKATMRPGSPAPQRPPAEHPRILIEFQDGRVEELTDGPLYDLMLQARKVYLNAKYDAENSDADLPAPPSEE